MKIGIIVFNWRWEYIGQRVIEGDESIFPKLTDSLAWDDYNRLVARQIAPGEVHTHVAAAVIDGPENEIEVTPELVADIKKGRADQSISHCETWEMNDVTIKTLTQAKDVSLDLGGKRPVDTE